MYEEQPAGAPSRLVITATKQLLRLIIDSRYGIEKNCDCGSTVKKKPSSLNRLQKNRLTSRSASR